MDHVEVLPLSDRNRVRMDAARYNFLCAHPHWGFIEELCREFAGKSAAEFKAGLDAAIAKRWNADEFLRIGHDALSAKPKGEAVAWESFLSSLRSGERQTVIDSASRGESLTRKAFEAGVTAYPPRSHGVVVDDALVELAEQKLLECGCEIIPSRDAMLAAITTIIEELQNET